jgi:integrase
MGNPYGLMRRPGSDNWYVRITIPGSGGKMHVESTYTTDLILAKKKLLEVQAMHINLDPKTAGKGASMSIELFTKMLLDRYSRMSRSAYQQMKRAFKLLNDAVPLSTLGDINPKTLNELREYWKKTGYVDTDDDGNVIGVRNVPICNRYIISIIAAMHWAEDHDEIELPVQNWRKVTKGAWNEATSRVYSYEPEQREKLRKKAAETSDEMLTLFMLAYHTGMRLAEVRHFRREDVDFRKEIVHIREKVWTDPKTGKPQHWAPKTSKANKAKNRVVPIDAELNAFLTKRLAKIPGDWVMSETTAMPFQEANLGFKWGKIVKESGVKLGSAHTLRHAFATDKLAEDERLEDVQKWMGHSSIVMTQRYVHYIPTRFKTMEKPQ